MFSTGISGERDEDQDVRISDLELRILELEDMACIGDKQVFRDIKIATVEDAVDGIRKTLRKQYSKKLRFKLRDWYRRQK
jgi:hypothetical protein